MKIAFVRGPFLNPWELQTYSGIAQTHPFIAVGGSWQFYPGPISVPGIRIAKTPVWGEFFSGTATRTFYNRTLSWTLGRSYGLGDLDTYCRSIDILHAAELHTTLTYQCLQMKRRYKTRLVLTVWENLLHMGETHPLRRWRKQAVIREADGFLAVTETTRRMLIKEGVPPDRISTIPMAVDLHRFQPISRTTEVRSRWGFFDKDFVILFMGRFVVEKGVLDLIEAIPKVLQAASGRSVRFCFIGAGPLETELHHARARFPQSIVIQPFLSYEEIPAFHNIADVFVLPSKAASKWQEQFGYVLIESMACGKTVLTTRSGSIPDVVGDAGLLTEPGRPDLLAQKLIELVREPDRLRVMGMKARHRTESIFSVTAVTPLLQTFYKKAYERKS
jgi:alpha-maltose-1-phosphate synthase